MPDEAYKVPPSDKGIRVCRQDLTCCSGSAKPHLIVRGKLTAGEKASWNGQV